MTQEFVTLPREVVERALEALLYEKDANAPLDWCHDKEIKALRAALEHPQNHIPGVRNMVPTGWKLVPVEPTVEMMDAGGAATRRCYQHLNKGEVMCSYVYRHMLDAAPQPPTTEQSSAVQQPQVEQEPVAWISPSALEWSTRESEKVVKLTRKAQPEYDFTEPLYTHPQPKREPLSLAQIAEVFGWKTGYLPTPEQVHDARAIEAAHNIK